MNLQLTTSDPSRNLWASVVLQVYDDLTASPSAFKARDLYIKDSAKSWLLSDNTDPGSLTWICTVLDLNEAIIRKKLLSLTQSLPEGENKCQTQQ
jgi:hypothetical protein